MFVESGVGKDRYNSSHRGKDQFKKTKLEFHLTRGVQRWNKLRRKDKRLVQAAPVWMLRAAISCNEVASCGMCGLWISLRVSAVWFGLAFRFVKGEDCRGIIDTQIQESLSFRLGFAFPFRFSSTMLWMFSATGEGRGLRGLPPGFSSRSNPFSMSTGSV